MTECQFREPGYDCGQHKKIHELVGFLIALNWHLPFKIHPQLYSSFSVVALPCNQAILLAGIGQ